MRAGEWGFAVASAAMGAVVGWAIPKALDLAAPEVFSAFASDPVPVSLLCGLTGLCGFAVGRFTGRRSPRETRREIAVARRQFLDETQREFLSLSLDARTFVFAIREEGPRDMRIADVKAMGLGSKFVRAEDMGYGRARYFIDERYKRLFDEREEECFRSVRDFIDEESRKERQ